MCAGDKSIFTFVDSRFAIALVGKNCQIVVFLSSPLHPTIGGGGGGVLGGLWPVRARNKAAGGQTGCDTASCDQTWDSGHPFIWHKKYNPPQHTKIGTGLWVGGDLTISGANLE